MKITKELILKLFENKDAKRKKMLFELYKEYFLAANGFSISFLVEIINTDLQVDIVSKSDIKYIREHYTKKNRQEISVEKKPLKYLKEDIQKEKNSDEAIQWTDPDEVPYSNNFKTKFNKK